MIRRIHGEVVEIAADSVLIEVNGLGYEVLVSAAVRDRIAERGVGHRVELHTYNYLAIEQNRATPFLLGFENEAQLAFFERLLDVPRIGPMMALRMMILPVATIAAAIETQDTRVLESLPGVGRQKARDLIATLQGKIGRFVDAKDLTEAAPSERPLTSAETDALEMLMQLGYTRADAARSIAAAMSDAPEGLDSDDIVRRVFAGRGG